MSNGFIGKLVTNNTLRMYGRGPEPWFFYVYLNCVLGGRCYTIPFSLFTFWNLYTLRRRLYIRVVSLRPRCDGHKLGLRIIRDRHYRNVQRIGETRSQKSRHFTPILGVSLCRSYALFIFHGPCFIHSPSRHL